MTMCDGYSRVFLEQGPIYHISFHPFMWVWSHIGYQTSYIDFMITENISFSCLLWEYFL